MTITLFLLLANLFADHVDNPGQTAIQSVSGQDHVENPSNTPLKP
ncbi:MAG TPA: hypothetical protein VE783_06450 [Candidatus Limnocylindrales bacterium]|nr:hypothetical protein [Candidatus Limnocylindrales bacterium]